MGKNDPNAIKKIAADFVNAEKEDGERHPGGHRHRPQEVDRSVEKVLDNGIPADQHSERNAGGGGNREAGRDAFEAHEEVKAPRARIPSERLARTENPLPPGGGDSER